MKLGLLIGVIGTTLLLSLNIALADTAKDIKTISSAVGFIAGGPSGEIEMAVLYDPSVLESRQHANEIVSLTAQGVGSKVKLTGKKVAVGSMAAITAHVIFLTRGTELYYESALTIAKKNGGVTVSTDEGCLGKGCILVVKTKPNVDILISPSAAAEAGVHFSSIFSMMSRKR